MMSDTTNLSIRIDKNLKKQAEELFEELGLDITTAFNIFIRQAIRQGKIPFEISIDPFYTVTNQARLKESIEDLKAGNGIVEKTLEELKAMEDK